MPINSPNPLFEILIVFSLAIIYFLVPTFIYFYLVFTLPKQTNKRNSNEQKTRKTFEIFYKTFNSLKSKLQPKNQQTSANNKLEIIEQPKTNSQKHSLLLSFSDIKYTVEIPKKTNTFLGKSLDELKIIKGISGVVFLFIISL